MFFQVTTYGRVRIPFMSCDDWTPCTDLARCSPEFRGTERNDAAMFQEGSELSFGRIHLLFSCCALGKEWSIAFITRCNLTRGSDLSTIGLRVVEELPSAEFILIGQLVRAAHLVPTYLNGAGHQTWFVNDAVDNDMFLRLDALHQNGS